MRLIVHPETLVDVAVLMLIPTFAVSLIVVPLALVSISVLEHLLSPAFALVVAVQITGENTRLVLFEAMLFDKVKTFFLNHKHEFLLIGVRPVRSLLAILTQSDFVLVGAAQVDFTFTEGIHAIDCSRSILCYALHALRFASHTLTKG